MTKEEIIEKFGFDPQSVGIRHRGYWIVTEIGDEEKAINIQLGDLCIQARDGADNEVDEEAEKYGNYLGECEDFFDQTYLYYYYRAIK